jgi:hypothetical protein
MGKSARFHPMIRIELNDNEHFALIMALALRIRDLEEQREPQSPMFGILAYMGHLGLLRRLLEAPKLPEGQASAPSTAAACLPQNAAAVSTARQPTPVVTTSEKVAERIPDKETGELTITPVSVEQNGKAMVVSYQIRSGQKTRTTKTRCWDPKLFSALVASVGQTTTFLTRESKGFLNIVGVKPGVKT